MAVQITTIIKVLIAVYACFAMLNVAFMAMSNNSITEMNAAHEARHRLNVAPRVAGYEQQHEYMMAEMQERVYSSYRTANFFNRLVSIVSFMFAFAGVGGTALLLSEVERATTKEKEASQITKREEQLRETAEEENRAKTQFLARMSHEIRTPMNAVLGIAEIELLKANHPRETEEAFLRIHSSSKLLLAVINDILDMSKVEAGKMEIVPAVYDVSRALMDTIMLNIANMGDKGIEFKLEVNENLPATLIGDELRIKQVLNNFLSNAFKYTEKGTVTLSVGKVGTVKDGNEISLVFTVTDTGQGLTPEEIAKMFESEYTRFNVEANRSIEGTGLGMSIARQLIAMMNGKIKVESTVGEGSVFTITLPQKVSGTIVLDKESIENLKNMKAVGTDKKTRLVAEPMPYGKVLAVDDIESNLYVIEGYLIPYQIQFETVSSGKEAIEKVKGGAVYDVIFMDHMMPEMDGIEATKILREMGYTQPIVALTANTIKGAMELFMNNGFSGFIAKPIDLYQLNAQLIQHVRDTQSPEVIEAAKSLASGTQLSASDSVLSERIAHSFIRDAKKAMDIMDSFVSLKNPTPAEIRPFAIQAHGMKSALANIQKYILSETAKTLEDAANEKDIQKILSQAPDFIKSVYALIEEMTPPPELDDSGMEYVDSNPEMLAEQLKIIETACDMYNKKDAAAAMKLLRQETWSANTNTLLADIEAKLLHSDFEAVAEIIKGFRPSG
ncbi:MAG: ATP-binding protein [Defluviitaleaceae bacterium]|nr:ATP-binding protein [Defluviitaleaceae bacterium]MCL2262447.1 ATP-binding protein [Defluviitaleaceae bacterium]